MVLVNQQLPYLRVMHPVIVCDLLALGDKSLGHDQHVAADVVSVEILKSALIWSLDEELS